MTSTFHPPFARHGRAVGSRPWQSKVPLSRPGRASSRRASCPPVRPPPPPRPSAHTKSHSNLTCRADHHASLAGPDQATSRTSSHPKTTRAMERPGLCGLGTCVSRQRLCRNAVCAQFLIGCRPNVLLQVLRVNNGDPRRVCDPSETAHNENDYWKPTRLGILCGLGLCVSRQHLCCNAVGASSFSLSRISNLLPQVLAALPWVWPVSVAPTPAGGNTTDAGSCLDPDSDNYLDCCDEFGVALKPYWVLLVSAFIFTLLLGTTKSTPQLIKQIEAELPQRRAATVAKRKAVAARGRCCRWVCCASRCPLSLDYWVGTGTADRASKAKTKGIEAKAAETEAMEALWRPWRKGQTTWATAWMGCWCSCCCWVVTRRHYADQPRAASQGTLKEKAEPAGPRDRWVWLILGIQLLHAIGSTALLVVELRARGVQGWELFQAATLLSSNSSLGGFLAAAAASGIRMGDEGNEQLSAGVYKVVLKKNKRVKLGMAIDVTTDAVPSIRKLIKRAMNLAWEKKEKSWMTPFESTEPQPHGLTPPQKTPLHTL